MKGKGVLLALAASAVFFFGLLPDGHSTAGQGHSAKSGRGTV